LNKHDIIFRYANLPDFKQTQTPYHHDSTHCITLVAVTLFAVSSCTTHDKAPASQSMPGMSAAEHARM